MNIVLITEGKSAFVKGKAKDFKRLQRFGETSDLREEYWLEINVEHVEWFDEVATRSGVIPTSVEECWAFDKASSNSHIRCSEI